MNLYKKAFSFINAQNNELLSNIRLRKFSIGSKRNTKEELKKRITIQLKERDKLIKQYKTDRGIIIFIY